MRAEAQDQLSEERDDRATVRDAHAAAREQQSEHSDADAAADRADAWRDRQGAAGDRRHAADDRAAALSDRRLSAQDRTDSATDELTGAHNRSVGLHALAREIARAQRTATPLVLAYADLDGFKATNDSLGHAAGDRRLSETVSAIRRHLRTYDLVIRLGGDEFACALPDVSAAEAAQRFSLVNDDLAAAGHEPITVGIAELRGDDGVDALVARADRAMYDQRRPPTP